MLVKTKTINIKLFFKHKNSSEIIMNSWLQYQASAKEGEKETRERFQHSQGRAFWFGFKLLPLSWRIVLANGTDL